MKVYGNSYWQEATDNKDKTVAIMSDDVFQNIFENIEKSGLNYCAYSDGNTAMVAVNTTELEKFKDVAGLDDSLCHLRQSNKEHIPQDKNVIGNTEYRYIPNKTYVSEDRETILKMAEIANRENVPFSARIYTDGNATMTISKSDEARVNEIKDSVLSMRGIAEKPPVQKTKEIIGNVSYRDIKDRHFFVSPLTPENYKKIEPILLAKDVEFSGLIRNNNVMFTVENDKSQDFYNKLNEAIYESSLAELPFEERFADDISEMTTFLSDNEQLREVARTNDYDEFVTAFDDEFVNHVLLSDNKDFKDSFFDEFSMFNADFTDNIFGELRDKIFEETEKTPVITEPVEDFIKFSWGDSKEWFTESEILGDFAEKNPEISFALSNAVLAYLDEKQHTEREIPELDAGWYKKTDFVVSGVLNGAEFNYEGRFDIGDGVGNGSLIDHIAEYQNNIINSDRYPFDNAERKSEAQEALDTFIPFLKAHSELSEEEQQILADFKAENPIRTALEVEKQTFRIYQMRSGEAYHDRRFEGLEQNQGKVNYEDYVQVYKGDLSKFGGDSIEEKLESLYAEFNMNRPKDFKGHSLSVSDVVTIEENHTEKPYYVNSFGFTEFDGFYKDKEIVEEIEIDEEARSAEFDKAIATAEKKIQDFDPEHDDPQILEGAKKVLSTLAPDKLAEIEKEQNNPVVSDFRAKTEELFNNINGYTPEDIENSVRDYVFSSLYENGINAEIGEVIVSGSRSRGLEHDNSDIDVVVEIKDSDLKEDALFNILHEEDFDIDGIPIDINPIRPEETGTLETYLPSVEEYLAEKANVLDNKENERTANDIAIGDKYFYIDKEVTVTSLSGVYPDDVGISEKHKAGNLEYETTSNIDKFTLHNLGKYLGNDKDNSEKSIKMTLYHGTMAEDFERFRPDYRGAIWSDTTMEHATQYAGSTLESKVLTCEAQLQNPAHFNFGSHENWDIDSTIRDARSNEHDSAIIDFKFIAGDNSYFKFMLENYPDKSAEEVLGSMMDASSTDALKGETVAEFAKRMEASDNITHSYVAVFNPDAIKIVDRTSVYEPEIDNSLEEAKNNINEFCQSEYGSDADFSDLSKINLAYTTDEDTGLAIQVSADLEQYRMIFEYYGDVVREEQFNSLDEMNENALSVLDYTDLISLSDDEKTPVVAESIGIGEDIDEDKPLFADQEALESIVEADNITHDTGFQGFQTNPREYVQMSLFGEEEPVSQKQSFFQGDSQKSHSKTPKEINGVDTKAELIKDIQRGSGFENGKNRINKFYQEQKPNKKEFADFLKNEYGIGGHSADDPIDFVSYDAKGIEFSLPDDKFSFNWTEVAKQTADLIDKGEYFTDKKLEKAIEAPVQEEKSVVDVSDKKEKPVVQPELDETVVEDTSKKQEESAVSSEQGEKATDISKEKAENFTITDNTLGEGGAKTKFKNNLAAIQTLKQIESENRKATPEEQEIMSKYVGWGGISQVFDSENKSWENEFHQLRDILDDKEYSDARGSVLDSFFTAPAVIDGIYEALDKFGFEGGNILEPSMGVGNFVGKMPSEMSDNSKVYGVEVDSITGRIAQQLYPNADIQVTGFEHTNFQNDSFDVAVGNVPFGDLGFPDQEYGTTKLHDYFFAKSIDKVKDGGIVAFITSKGTLDKKDESFRKQLSEKADLIGAVRLPNNAFKANAGTEVTSDIIFLQKRSTPPEITPEWVHLKENDDGLRVNSYFADNPDMALGKIVEGNKLYGRTEDTMCVPFEGANLREQLSQAVQKLDATISDVKTNEVYKFSDKQVSISADNLRPFSFFKDDKGDIYFKGGEDKLGKYDVQKVMDSKHRDYKRVSDFIDMRDTTRTLLKVQAEDCPDNEIKALQNKLSQQYDNFYVKYGLMHNKKNKSVLREDCSYNLLLTLEKEYDKDKLISKSDIFTKRTIKPSKAAEHVDTALEALTISMAETAKVDLEYMSKLTDMSQEKLISDLKGEIFLVPDTENTYQSASEYLSGDIRQKLDLAEKAAETDNRFADNVTALKNAMPEPLKAGDIEVKIGATWIDPKLYEQFLYETLDTPRENRADKHNKFFWSKPKHITVDYSEHTGQFHIENKRADQSVTSTRDFGTRKLNAYEIMESLLNLKDPKIYKTVEVPDGMGEVKEKRVVDIEATKIAQQKANKLKNAFKDWIFKTPERAVPLVEQYNRQFNSVKPREYDGSALRFPGMNSSITLREHQKNAIAHALFGGNTLFAHCVGAGKTFEMIASVMESKRLGLSTKPLMAVPNHLTEQIGEDFQKLYPSANILVATKNDFKKENRQQLFAKIATGDFDAVIIGHSQLGMIPLSKERQETLLNEQINDIIVGIEELKKSEGSKFQVKQMERTKKSLEAKLDKLEKSHDDFLTFEEMGIDKLVVDELHEFKNVPTPTKLSNVAGISNSASQKALDLFMKVRYLDEKTGGKGFIGATGTPISNSVTELHTMMRFLEYDFLKDHGLANFDNWVSVFGNQKTEWELAPAGNRFKERTRIADYTGLPELMSMFKQVADVRTADTLNLPTPEMEYHIENVEATEFQKLLVQELSDRADDVQGGNIDPSIDNMLRITSDGRKLGLDPRLIDPSFEDNPNTKLNQCVRNVFQIYEDTAENKSTQIIFCDLGVPKKNSQSVDGKNDDEKSSAERESLEESGDFCVYDDIRDKLIEKGVKPEEIAYIHDAKTEQQKTDLFDKVNKGEVRVLLGRTNRKTYEPLKLSILRLNIKWSLVLFQAPFLFGYKIE